MKLLLHPKHWLTITTVFSLFILQTLGQPAFLKDGLVAYYPFNGNANDASGNGKNGVVQGPVSTTDRFGSPNSAYYFNGAGAPYHPDSQLPKPQRITSQLNQNFNNGFTFSAWVLADSVQKSGDNYIFGVGSNSNRRYGLSSGGEVGGKKVTTPGFRSIFAEYTSQSGYKVTPSVWGPNPQTEYNPANNQWLHIVYIASNTLKIFINGVEKDSQSVGGPTGEAITSIVLGDFEDPISGRCWQGKIDDVRIYNRALSAGEVKSLYDYESTPSVKYPLAGDGLFSYYPLSKDFLGQGQSPTIVTTSACEFDPKSNGLLFNGVDTYLYSLVDSSPFNNAEAYTLSFFVKLDKTPDSTQYIFGEGPSSEYTIVYITPDLKIGINQWRSDTVNNWDNFQSDKLDLLAGHFYTFVVSQESLTRSKISLFVDGVLVKTGRINVRSSPNGVNKWVFGNRASKYAPNAYSQPDAYLRGLLRSFSIYKKPLTDLEVVELYKNDRLNAGLPLSPEIRSQPQIQSISTGNDATFCVVMLDSGAYNYQWQFNEQNIAGATLNCYTINSVTAAMNGGRYRVIVSNAAGTVVSESAVLSVRSPEPYLSDGLVSYIAFDSNLNDSAQNANKLIASSKVSLVANRFGNVQSALQLESVNSYVTYTTNRLPQKNEDRSYSIWVLKNRDWNTVGGTGWGPILSYVGEWQKGQPWLEAYNNSSGSWVRFVGDVKTNPEAFSTAFVPQSYDSWQNIIVTYKSPLLKIYINGVLRSSKNIPQLSSIVTGPLMIGNINHPFPGIVDDFRCYNRELSALEVISLYDYEKPIDMPQIFTQPKDFVVQVNAAAEFCVGMSDNRLYKYQWQMDSKDIIDQTNMCLTINSAGSEFNGRRFRVIVSNTQGFVTSDPVSLTVVTPQPPSIATQPIGKTVQEGSNASFAVVASGQGALVYQWQLNEQNLPGATSATLNLNGVKQNQSGRYRVLVSSPYGVTISDTVSLIVNANPPPTIVTQPISKSPAEGTQVSLTVTATGLGALTYQWQVNNQNIPGATSSTLVLSAVRPSANGNYRVIVGNPYGTTISTEATVTIVVTDADSDGLSDYEELLFGTNANKADTDGDGLSDFSEVKTHSSNPLNTDTDGDGYTDGIEVAGEGNPNNRSVIPNGALAVFPAVDVEFLTVNGVKYQLEVSTDMVQWTGQGGVVIGNGSKQNHLVRANKATSFWRLKVAQ